MTINFSQRHWVPRFVLTGLLAWGALLIQIASGIEHVSTSRAQDAWRSLWLVEFNWPLALLLFSLALATSLGGLWLSYRQWRQLS
jgi:hypothetical protein